MNTRESAVASFVWPLAISLLVLSACSGGEAESPATVLVSAASSLTEAFGAIEEAFESSEPGTDVLLNLGGSSTLREQILEGAPADVFASANVENMDMIVAANMTASEPEIFATNRLQIAVPAGNPAHVSGLADLADEDLLIGLCSPEVPCGAFARRVLARSGVDAAIDTNEADVVSLLTKIEAGELDAGITYVTDVTSARGSVEGVDIPVEANVIATYPIAVLTDAPNPAGASSFVDFVVSDRGQAILHDHGFGPP